MLYVIIMIDSRVVEECSERGRVHVMEFLLQKVAMNVKAATYLNDCLYVTFI